jgi:hypothetical protein
MYAQAVIKPNTLLRNGAYGIVMRGVQKCTCAGASLRNKNYTPLNCITINTATDPCMGSVSLLLNAKKYATQPDYIKYYGQELNISTYNLAPKSKADYAFLFYYLQEFLLQVLQDVLDMPA